MCYSCCLTVPIPDWLCLTICLSEYLFVCLSVGLNTCLSYLSIWLNDCLSVCLFLAGTHVQCYVPCALHGQFLHHTGCRLPKIHEPGQGQSCLIWNDSRQCPRTHILDREWLWVGLEPSPVLFAIWESVTSFAFQEWNLSKMIVCLSYFLLFICRICILDLCLCLCKWFTRNVALMYLNTCC